MQQIKILHIFYVIICSKLRILHKLWYNICSKGVIMHNFDYSFLKDLSITSRLIGLSNVIAESNYRTKIQKNNNPLVYKKLHEKAIVESTIFSNRIEGVETSEKRNDEILNKNYPPLNHNEQEISGYKDAIVYISENYNDITINEDLIKHLHYLLMYYTPDSKGEYKKVDNEISIRYADGTSKSIFNPIRAKDVDAAMKNLIRAYNDAYIDSEINHLLLIPCFIVDFLSIHPFLDGNGRISRLLTLLLLYKEDYDIGKYISYEKMIDSYKWNYYQELNRSQTFWDENNNDYSFFIIFHFQMLYRCYMEIGERFISDENNKKLSKQKRIENVIMNSIVPISKADLSNKLPDISITTIEKALADLIKERRIIKIGAYKNARYIKNDEDI